MTKAKLVAIFDANAIAAATSVLSLKMYRAILSRQYHYMRRLRTLKGRDLLRAIDLFEDATIGQVVPTDGMLDDVRDVLLQGMRFEVQHEEEPNADA
ncbi:MAG: hypothetical protein AB7C95_00780 [Synergistaceae bacterium]